jgi:RsiW-degrading membrane proteinase PrsW (M82 family)
MASVDPKAVLEGRTPGRPPIGAIIGIIISSICLILVLGFMALSGASFVVGLALALLPLPLLLALVLLLDRLEPEPWNALLLAFFWGAGIAVLGALILNTLGMFFLTGPLLGRQEGAYVSATVGAPVVEETLKALVLFGMLWFRRHELNGPTDGIIYAAMVGLGFATVENVTYYIRASEADMLVFTFVLRGIISPLGHPLFTAMTGLGVAAAALSRPGAKRFLAPLFGLLGAMALHALWNGSTAFGLLGLAFAYGVGFIVLVVLIVVVWRDRRRTVRLIAEYLPRYHSTGLVSPQDVQMLCLLSGRRHARSWARSIGGARAKRAMGDYQQAATELALLHQRADRGAAEPRWFEQRRNALLHLMQLARQAFQVRHPQPPAAPWAAGGHSGFVQPAPPGHVPPGHMPGRPF